MALSKGKVPSSFFPLAWGFIPSPMWALSPLCSGLDSAGEQEGTGQGELSVSSLQRLVLSEVFL